LTGQNEKILNMLDGCCKNNRQSQQELYNWLFGFAMNICYRYTSLPEEAEELTHESFIKLYKNINQFETTRQQPLEPLLKAWFKKITINTCIDFLRRRHSMLNGYALPAESQEIAGSDISGFDKLSYNDIIEVVRKLSPVYRTVFNLFVIEGFTHDEIARKLGISVGASKSNLSKARHNLQKLIVQQNEVKEYATN
jgi:RNA polymerase sigma factor (sigma-70 family)